MLPSKQELAQRYTKFSDQKLLDIIYKNEARPEAIDAAKEELKKRDLSPETVTDFTHNKETKKIIVLENATIPLPLHQKFLFFVAWFIPFFFGGAYRLNYKEDGMFKKLKQSSWYSVAGFIALILTTIIAIKFDLGNISSISILLGLFCLFYVAETLI
ncbi:MAG: hypothetical protein WAZ98_14020 [Cyclobacteriaceae bacterium]